ncbi:MAG: hypothetical protein Q8P27_00515, partial [Candidatus Peregrinibacteria bacterium]|nr:hypothetical protein [Candidatus Peregrinibacteria bacterium]
MPDENQNQAQTPILPAQPVAAVSTQPVQAVTPIVPVTSTVVQPVAVAPVPASPVAEISETALIAPEAVQAVPAPKKGGMFSSLTSKWHARVEANKSKGDVSKTLSVESGTVSPESKDSKLEVKATIENPPKGMNGKPDYAKLSSDQKKQIVAAEKVFQKGLATIRDLIAPSSMEVAFDHLLIDGMFSKSFFVYTYPRYIETNWLSPVVNFDVTMDMSQFIYPVSSAKIMKTLKGQVAKFQSSMRMGQEKGQVRDPALETALEDAEQLRTDLQRGQERFYQFALYFTVYHEDQNKLEKISKQIESLLGGKLVLTRRADLRQEHAFNSGLP